MSDEHSKIIVFTDYEPDDLLALYLLRKQFDMFTIVVSENEAHTLQAKCEDAQHFFPNQRVLRGAQSSKARVFTKHEDASARTFSKYSTKGRVPPDIVFCIAPPRDMIAISMVDPCYFLNTRAFFYGGFNFRVISSAFPYFNLTEWLSSAFERVVVFENRLVFACINTDGTRSSRASSSTFTEGSGPAIAIETHAEREPVLKRVINLAYEWDKYMRTETRVHIMRYMASNVDDFKGIELDQDPRAAQLRLHQMGIRKRGDPEYESVARKMNVYISVYLLNFQLVAADPVVAVMFDEPDDSPRFCRTGAGKHGRSRMFEFRPNPMNYSETRAEIERKIVALIKK